MTPRTEAFIADIERLKEPSSLDRVNPSNPLGYNVEMERVRHILNMRDFLAWVFWTSDDLKIDPYAHFNVIRRVRELMLFAVLSRGGSKFTDEIDKFQITCTLEKNYRVFALVAKVRFDGQRHMACRCLQRGCWSSVAVRWALEINEKLSPPRDSPFGPADVVMPPWMPVRPSMLAPLPQDTVLPPMQTSPAYESLLSSLQECNSLYNVQMLLERIHQLRDREVEMFLENALEKVREITDRDRHARSVEDWCKIGY